MSSNKEVTDSNSISVVIPTRNRMKEVCRAIDSVLKQTLQPGEIIVVDDGSTDNTVNILKLNYPDIRLFVNEVNKGGSISRNIGAEYANGKYIAFLDSDDEWLPDHLENSIDTLISSKADGIFGVFLLHSGSKKIDVKFFTDIYQKGTMGKNIFSFKRFDARTSTFFLKRECFLKVKFDNNLAKHQDWDFAINFDQIYLWSLNTKPTVILHVPSSSNRMSNSLNHSASLYFLEKNSNVVHPNSLFQFCLKQIMRSQNINEPRSKVEQYLIFLVPLNKDLNFKNRFIYFLLNKGLLNISYLYRLKNLIKS